MLLATLQKIAVLTLIETYSIIKNVRMLLLNQFYPITLCAVIEKYSSLSI